MHGQNKVMEPLIAEGADINVKNGQGDTPLHYAAESGQINVVKLLLAKVAPIEKVKLLSPITLIC